MLVTAAFPAGNCEPPLMCSDLESTLLTAEVHRIAEEELGETEETRQTCLQTLRQLLASENGNPRTDNEFLLMFLRARKFNCKATFKLIKKYYAHRVQYAELYKLFTPEDMIHVLKTDLVNYLPMRSPEGYAVFVSQFGQWDPSVCSFEDVLRFGLMCNEKALENPVTQICGTAVIVDMKGLSLSHVLHCSIYHLRCFVASVQDCMPMRIKSIHILNAPRIFSLIFAIIKPLLKTKIQNRIHFYGSDLESFFNFFPVEMIPEEFGGNSGHFRNEAFCQSLLDSQDSFLANMKYSFKTNIDPL